MVLHTKSRALWVVLAMPLLASASSPAERAIVGDGMVAGSVNGAAFRLRVDAAATAIPIVTEEVARRSGLRPGIMDWEYLIGKQTIAGRSAVARIDTGTGPDKRRIGWTSRSYARGIDGVVGPGMLDHAIVRFQLRPARSGERQMSLPMVTQGGLDGRWGERFAEITVGGRRLKVQFDPHRDMTVATAQAGALIADEHDGSFVGAPTIVEFAFGIERPVRPLAVQRSLVIGPLTIRDLGVRTNDFGSASSIPTGPPDPNEIVVTAKGKSNSKYDQIKLGADVLDACSSLVFHLKAKRIELSCR